MGSLWFGMVPPLISAILTYGIWSAANQVRRRRPALADTDALQAPWPLVVPGWLGLAVFGGFSIWLLYDFVASGAEQAELLLFSICGLLFAALSAAYVAAIAIERHQFLPGGIRVHVWGRDSVRVMWRDIVNIHYERIMRRFRIQMADGRVVRISTHLTNLQRFSSEVLACGDHLTVSAEAREWLESAAFGNVPAYP